VCNVATQAGETAGYDVQDHVEALISHVGRDVFSVVVANDNLIPGKTPGGGAEWVRPPGKDQSDYPLLLADLADSQYPWRHDPAKLAQALINLTEDKA
jgi:2-phospho-L-lactate transferase/gluconeogenesis factor (CofD/UPF0052 family)